MNEANKLKRVMFSLRLKEATQDRWPGSAQKDVAEKMRVSRSTLRNWLADKNMPPTVELVRICEVLDISAEWLIFGIRHKDYHIYRLPAQSIVGWWRLQNGSLAIRIFAVKRVEKCGT